MRELIPQRKFKVFRLLTVAVALGLGIVATTPVWAQVATATSEVAVVMSGLDNPRGLALGPEGALYVAEAGRGPSDASCFTNATQQQCTCAEAPLLGTVCSGPTGAVSRLWHGRQERVVTGLPSWAAASGRAEGPNGVSMLGLGEAFVTIGLEAAPRSIAFARNALGTEFGRLVQFSGLSGEWRFVADLAAYEESNSTRCTDDPTRCSPDSNPFGLLVLPDERVVVDSGGNALLRVAADGEISTLAVLPTVPQARDLDAVPTSIALGPDAAFYVGVLTGAPFADGAANIYRVVPGESPAIVCTGFKAIISVAFDAQGNLYVLQHSTGPTMLTADGALFRIDAAVLLQNGCDRKANAIQVPTGNTRLIRPTAITVGPDGALYISNHGTSVGTGEVLRIEP